MTLVLGALFLVSIVGQAWTGWISEGSEQIRHGQPAPALLEYLLSGAFLSALFENWESEFLQMAVFVVLSAHLYQRGSPESRDPDKRSEKLDRDPALDADKSAAPTPVRAGRFARVVYSHSLGVVLFLLFVASFLLHLVNSARAATERAIAHGEPPHSFVTRLSDAEFWFESFQNWQSEFLSTAVLIVLAIYLRERGSPQSKPVSAPHAKTGSS